MTDISAVRRVQRRRRDRLERVTLPCEGCGRRIAWWDEQVRAGIAYRDSVTRGWKWQGQVCPVSFRGELVDVSCPSCGWPREGVARQPYPFWWAGPPEIL